MIHSPRISAGCSNSDGKPRTKGAVSIRTFKFLTALGLVSGILTFRTSAAGPQQASASHPAMDDMSGHDMSSHMAHMSGHMYMTTLRPISPGDQEKADAVVAAVKQAIAPYEDYRKAMADGFQVFLRDVQQPQYHFTNRQNWAESARGFDPRKPSSLLYTKTSDGGYKLVGVMYTDRLNATESELNHRIPLSIARWHQHINFCQAPPNETAAYFGPNAKFGLQGSIITRQACEAAGGTFHPHFLGWMVHVYPFESDPKKRWAMDPDDMDHDNMDHSAMPGMKMD